MTLIITSKYQGIIDLYTLWKFFTKTTLQC